MRSHEEIEAAQAKFLAVQTGAVTMPDEFYGLTNNYKLGCMVKELARDSLEGHQAGAATLCRTLVDAETSVGRSHRPPCGRRKGCVTVLHQ
jgi:hypothetical protein